MQLHEIPFQLDRPVFVRIPFFAMGRQYKAGDEFKWKEVNVPDSKAIILYRERYIIHNPDLETKLQVGDGLETLEIESLNAIVDDYNKRIAALNLTAQEFATKKVKSSRIASKQRGLIRQWRRNFADWLDKAEKNKKG